jgi:hypothetical protein
VGIYYFDFQDNLYIIFKEEGTRQIGTQIKKINGYYLTASGLVVRVTGYRTEMYCVSCEVRTEFMYVM